MWHLDLFSGIGGFALAANWAGYDTIGFCEIDPYCQRVLRTHWPTVPVWGDVRTLGRTEVRRALADASSEGRQQVLAGVPAYAGTVRSSAERDEYERDDQSGALTLITAGYPCQPFSLAGKRLGAEDDRHLWPEVKRLLAELRPARFLGENVAGHINMGLDDVLSDLEEIGYTARAVVLPACAVNAPHRRDRVWIMGHANEPGSQGHGQHGERAGERLARASSLDARADVADTESGVRFGAASGATGHAAFSGEAAAHAAHKRVNGSGGAWNRGAELADGGSRAGTEAQQCVGVPNDGLPGLLADPRWGDDPLNAFGSDWEDGVPRVVATEKDRVNRLKALGNAIVPQVAYQVLLAMNAEAA